MANRYEISDVAWDLVADLFTQPRRTGRPRIDDRLMLNGVLWLRSSGGQASDIAYAQPLLDDVCVPTAQGRPRNRYRWLLANKCYDVQALRRYCDRYWIGLACMAHEPAGALCRGWVFTDRSLR